MKYGTGELVELFLEGGLTGGRLLCPQNLIPEPGQYLLVFDSASGSLLSAPVFNAGSVPGGFLVSPPISPSWQPGMTLSLRGPLGRGFTLPKSTRRVALVALAETPLRMKPLLVAALEQNASVVLVSDLELPALPPEVEIQPVPTLTEVIRWSDYLAIDVDRKSLPGLHEMLGLAGQVGGKFDAQVFINTPMPCGGMGNCGVCAVTVRRGWRMSCEDGPVFDLKGL